MYSPIVLLVLVGLLTQGESTCAPGSVKQRGVTTAQQTEIVKIHNHYRTLVAQGKILPKAGNMKKMSWDAKLAAAAQKISDTCVYDHVEVNDTRWDVGQNLFLAWFPNYSTKVNWTEAVTSWFSELYTANYTYKPQGYDGEAGHYTQVINAASNKVGCGMTHYYSDSNYFQFLVCNYGPAGNFFGQYPYLKGTGCTNLCN